MRARRLMAGAWRGRPAWAALCLLLCLPSPLPAATCRPALSGRWQPLTASGRTTGTGRTFDVARLISPGARRGQVRVTLQPAATCARGPGWVVTVAPMPLVAVTLQPVAGSAAVGASLTDRSGLPMPSAGRLAFPLPAAYAGQPIRLDLARYRGGHLPPMRFALQQVGRVQQASLVWNGRHSLWIGGSLAMALVGLMFALILRDTAFAWYAAYIVCYLAFQALRSGYRVQPLGLPVEVDPVPLLGLLWAARALFMAVFFVHLVDLRRQLPHAWRVLPVLAALVVLLESVQVMGLPAAGWISLYLARPLIGAFGLTLLALACWLSWRGVRLARLFLCGWLPVLLVAGGQALQLRGYLLGLTTLADWSVPAGAFETVVLSLALGLRARDMHRDLQRARHRADTDDLTGIFSRQGWYERCRTLHGHCAVLFIDLDRFKALNDRFGHASGDRALVGVAQALRHALRQQDLLGRFGGEEFVACLPGLDRDAALQQAETLRRRIHDVDEVAELTASIGVACGDVAWLSALVDAADGAMYRAKRAGGDAVQLEPAMATQPPAEALG